MALDEYIAALQNIETLARAQRYVDARAAAITLHGQVIQSPAGEFHADDTIAHAFDRPNRVDPKLATRLAITIAELRAARAPGTPASQPDLNLVNEIEQQQHAALPRVGGDTGTKASDRILSVGTAIGKAWEWAIEKLGNFFEWLGSFWPESKPDEKETTHNIRGIVIGLAIVIAALIAALAWNAVRRGRRAAPELLTSAAPAMSARDEDPLSRASNEWEHYAAQLAAAARYREAIRAWYHAVLVTLYCASILHFRKGRTNWEYVSALAPSLAWRRQFIELTRRFEAEWYGATESTAEALDDCSRSARAILTTVTRVSRGAA
jgi:hypothetical protein